MSSTRSRLLALAVLTVAVAGAGAVALGLVCDFDPACGEQVDRAYTLSAADGESQVLSYGIALEDGVVVAESVDWTADPPDREGTDGEGEVFLLAVHKNEIPLEPGERHALANGTGSITWDTGSTDTRADAGDVFRFTLLSETGGQDVELHRTQVRITR